MVQLNESFDGLSFNALVEKLKYNSEWFSHYELIKIAKQLKRVEIYYREYSCGISDNLSQIVICDNFSMIRSEGLTFRGFCNLKNQNAILETFGNNENYMRKAKLNGSTYPTFRSSGMSDIKYAGNKISIQELEKKLEQKFNHLL